MNICTFTGYIIDDPVLESVDGISFLDLRIVVYNYRRSKSTGEKNRTPVYLDCEAWHTGAETIAKLGRKGTKITVNCSAKHASGDDDFVVFRISEFDFACLDQD